LNGVVYVIGGYNGSKCVKTTQCFNPDSGTWWYAAEIPTALKAGSCGVINGKIYLSGGSTYSSASGLYDPVSQTSVYDPSSGWTVLDTTVYPYGQPGACCGVVNDCLYVIGGGSSASVLNYCLIPMRK
jgi:N-acetylneuraminic acid mutarotase